MGATSTSPTDIGIPDPSPSKDNTINETSSNRSKILRAMGSIFQIIIMIMNRLDYPQLLNLQNTSKMSPRTIVIIRNTNSKAYLITQSASKMNVTGTLRPSLSNFDNRKRNMNMSMNMVYYFIVYAELR